MSARAKLVVAVFFAGLLVPVALGSIVAWNDAHERVLFARGGVVALAFSEDGSKVASLGEHGDFHVWDTETGESLVDRRVRLDLTQTGWSATISPRLDEVACIAGGSVEIGSLLDGRLVARVSGQLAICAVRFSRDGTSLACLEANEDRGAGPIVVTSASGKARCELAHPDFIGGMSWTPAGELVTTCADGKLRMWSPSGEVEQEIALTVPGEMLGACGVSANGELIVVAGSVSTIDWARRVTVTREFVRVLRRDGTATRQLQTGPASATLAPCGDMVALQSFQRDEFHVVELAHGAELGHLFAKHFVFSPVDHIAAWDDGDRVHLAPLNWLGRRINLLH